MKTEYSVVNDATVVSSLTIDAFVRSVAISSGRPLSFLLGAGASLSSGMPSAERCIWEWKRDIFVSNNPSLKDAVGELSLPGTRSRIQSWLDLRGDFPVAGCETEYSFYAQECYPITSSRRSFFQGYVQKAIPHIGYRLLPLLVKANLLRTVWTTNFDTLPARACAAANVIAVEIGCDCSHRTMRPPVKGELRIVSLHGDFRYDSLKNTEAELQDQEAGLKAALLEDLRQSDLVVLGYSGRDHSLMSLLEKAYLSPGQTRLYWCGYGDQPSESVKKLLNRAHTCGREVFYIDTEGFDDVITRLALRCLNNEYLQEAKTILESSGRLQYAKKLFTIPPLEPTALFKSNAYPVQFPKEVLQAKLRFPEGVKKNSWLDLKLAGYNACGVIADDGAILMGDATELSFILAADLANGLTPLAISKEDYAKDGRIKALVRQGLLVAAAKQFGVETDGRRLWEPKPYMQRPYDGCIYQIHRAVKAHLMLLSQEPMAVLTPEVVVLRANGKLADIEVTKALRNEVYGYQHNKVFDADLQHWIAKLTEKEIQLSANLVFRIRKVPWYAGLHQKSKTPLSNQLKRFAKQSGLIVPDTPLIFSSKSGDREVQDVHPLHGLVTNKPWDYGLTQSGLATQVDLAIICSEQDARRVQHFLSRMHERARPGNTEQDYLLDYPGFAQAFGLPLNVPAPGDPNWFNLNDHGTGNVLQTAKQLGQRLCHALEAISYKKAGTVVLIYVPTRWRELNVVQAESEQFNLHDYVKAYAARRGLSTQFIREETTRNQQLCRIRWWLGLALYAKALRTPWRINCIDEETAYVGIGYSINHEAALGKHILLGCSHLYSARGEGLQFRLGRIENPVIRGKNPFMSEDDARRTGETIRQLFFEAKMRLPKRVVIHKRTYFTQDEQRGLCQGLEGIGNVELIEINIEESLRYLASKRNGDSLIIDSFPVPRGTTVVLNGHSVLLWVHGAAPNIAKPNFKYYQVKRRIPAELLIRRYSGQSDVVQVASEILGLSKMNWNHFDYYSQLPATLESAGAIARVGTYLSAFSSAAYDYRLLI